MALLNIGRARCTTLALLHWWLYRGPYITRGVNNHCGYLKSIGQLCLAGRPTSLTLAQQWGNAGLILSVSLTHFSGDISPWSVCECREPRCADSSLCVLAVSIRQLWAASQHPLIITGSHGFNTYSAGSKFRRQNLTSVDVRFCRLKSIRRTERVKYL